MMSLAWSWLLATVRLWTLLRVQASWRAALGVRWEWIAVSLAAALALAPALAGPVVAPKGVTPAALALALEGLLGSVVGLAASLAGWALVGASHESEVGLGIRGDGPGSLALALVCASLAAGLALGLHGPLLGAGLQLFERFPLGSASAWRLELDPRWLGALAFDACALALALATPVLLVRFLVSTMLATLRGGPDPGAWVVDAVVPGLRTALALVALGAAWSAYPAAFARGL